MRTHRIRYLLIGLTLVFHKGYGEVGVAHLVALTSVGYIHGRSVQRSVELPPALRDVARSIVRLESTKASDGSPLGKCTATVVAGCLLTASHCVYLLSRGLGSFIKVLDESGKVLGEVERFHRADNDRDLVVMKTKIKLPKDISLPRNFLSKEDPSKTGTPVYGFGYGSPGHYELSALEPILSLKEREYEASFAISAGKTTQRHPLQWGEMAFHKMETSDVGHRRLVTKPKISDVFSPLYQMPFLGDSGGPVFTADGKFAGVSSQLSVKEENGLKSQTGELTAKVIEQLGLEMRGYDKRFKITRFSIPIIHRAEFSSIAEIEDEIGATLDFYGCQ